MSQLVVEEAMFYQRLIPVLAVLVSFAVPRSGSAHPYYDHLYCLAQPETTMQTFVSALVDWENYVLRNAQEEGAIEYMPSLYIERLIRLRKTEDISTSSIESSYRRTEGRDDWTVCSIRVVVMANEPSVDLVPRQRFFLGAKAMGGLEVNDFPEDRRNDGRVDVEFKGEDFTVYLSGLSAFEQCNGEDVVKALDRVGIIAQLFVSIGDPSCFSTGRYEAPPVD